ncbi:type IA DNA topoisomerase [uncultured Alistipes sp.]|uniref:type IA DNA topoisomerase n=1 Tax=uncultured Alistipes sp. TaxID=538949 RepID=UPI0025937D2A|nr:type IA DNA topoisomerase [uncultured Alistipes sp.]
MQVIIAEKPSVAREIAAIVGAKNRKEGFIEGNGYAVTWAFGHLVGLAMPEQYGIEGFKAENLPILPPKFILLPRQIREGKEYKSDPGVVKQLGIIKELFNMADRIVVATDAGREGELIFRYIYSFLDCCKPFVRLWISSLTDKAIREGLQHLRPGEEYDALYLSAKARSEADWVVGINASQALAIAAGRGSWSLGRVQTPTLAIICSRYLENKAFKPATYFQLKLHTAKDATVFSALSAERFDDETAAQAAYATVMDADGVRVVAVERKEVKEQPPLLYDLTTLQKEANTRYGFSADKTLGIAQTLYEKKHITYPRTGSRYIPEDVAAEIRPLLATLREHPLFGRKAAAVAGSEINRRSVDNDKVTDHHALLITEVAPTSLPTEEQTIYDLIAGRMVEAFGGICIKEVSTARLECGGMEFVAKGTVVREDGWRKVWREPEEQADDTTAALPALQEGDELPVKGCDVEHRQTKPHPIHTESSLLAAMETAGRSLTDEAEREAMKDSGIGTPATRAAIIETLVARDYIRRKKKSLVPTDKGLAVYRIVKDKKIADVAMTGGWELALAKIATAEMDAFTFHRSIEVYAAQIAKELLAVKVENTPERGGAVCPRCGKQVVFYPKVAKCRNADCGLTVWRTIARKELTDAQLADLMTKGKTSVIKGFTKSNGETFEAAFTLDKEYKTVFDFAPRNKPKAGKGNKRK